MERKPDLRPVAGCAAAGLAVVAATVFVRRVATDSLSSLPAGEAAAYAAAFAFSSFWASRRLTAGLGISTQRTGDAATVVATLGFVAGLTTSGIGALTCVVACLGVVGILTLTVRDTAVTGARVEPGATQDVADVPRHAERGTVNGAGSSGSAEREELPPPAARLVRTTRDGRQVLEGVMRFELPAGETAHVLHVPLWPPLDGDPVVTCELEEIEGRVRVPVAKSYGLRIEVRVSEPVDEPLSGAVRFVAECPIRRAA